MDVFYGGLEKKIAIFDHKKIFKNIQLYIFLQFLVIKTLIPDPDSLEMLDPETDSLNPDLQLWTNK